MFEYRGSDFEKEGRGDCLLQKQYRNFLLILRSCERAQCQKKMLD